MPDWDIPLKEFQSTHPQGVRLMKSEGLIIYDRVSIHAPAGGATESAGMPLKTILVSIHAPAGGATPVTK